MQRKLKWHFLSAEEPDPSNIWISKISHRIQKKVLIPLYRGKKEIPDRLCSDKIFLSTGINENKTLAKIL